MCPGQNKAQRCLVPGNHECERRREDSAETFPETQAEIGRFAHQLQPSELIVAVYEKEHLEGQE